MKKLFSVILILLLFFLLLPASVSAESADVYVSSTGSDENSGTAESPYATLTKAIEEVANNGTIHVVGTVAVTSDITCTARGQSITITGDTLDLTAVTSVVFGDAVTFQNITIAGSTDAVVRIFANGYKMVMDEGITTSGNIELLGGGNISTVENTDLKVLSGTYKAIYGGGKSDDDKTTGTGKVNGNVNLYVGGTTNASIDHTSHDKETGSFIFGGGQYAAVGGKVSLTFTENAEANYIFGGGRGAKGVVSGGVRTVISGGKTMSVAGGGYGSADSGGVELVITGGTMDQVFGGSERASANGDVTVWLLGGTINRRVFGGCYNDDTSTGYHVTGRIHLLVGAVNLDFTYSGGDCGIYACSRYITDSSETTELIFADKAGYDANKDKLGADNLAMTLVMGSADVADAIHYFTYTASGDTIAGTCTYEDGCTVAPQVTLSLDSDASLQYTGKAITPAVVTTSNWYGDVPEIVYENNTEEGTATASITVNGATASLNFEIEPVYFRSLSLGESIAINFKATRSFLEARELQKVEFYMDGKLMQTVTGIPAGNADRVRFMFNQLTPAQMGKAVTARFCFADGTYDERSTSVLAYALSMLGKTEDAKLKTLLVDMLGYGAATQTYVGDTEALVNANLGDYADLGTTADPELVNHTALSEAPETVQATWLSAGLNLKDSVTVRLKFSADSVDGLTLKVTCDGNTWEITDFRATTGGYYAYFSGLNPAQLRLPITAAFYNAEGAQVSQSLTYSVVSYAYAVANGSDETLKLLTTALMRYGDAVSAWGGNAFVASVIADGKTAYVETLEEAIERANAADTDAKIVVWEDISVGAALDIDNNITIVNAPGKEITISRDGLVANMLTVNAGGSLTLGTNDAAETGKLILDGASEAAIAYRTVTVESGASFTLNKNATLCNANSIVNGGNVYVSTGSTFDMYGGTLAAGQTTGTGGNVYIQAGSTGGVFNMHSGTVTGGQAQQGGNIYVAAGSEKNAAGEFHLYDGTISDGNGNAAAGNVCALGIMQMEGGTITGGSIAESTSNIAANVLTKANEDPQICSFTMTGGHIYGGVRLNDTGSVRLGGTAKISGGETGLTFSQGIMTTTGFSEGAEIYVSMAEDAYDTHFGVTEKTGDEKFVKLMDQRGVAAIDSKLYVLKDWTSTEALPTTEGKYRLTAAVTVSSASTTEQNVQIYLDLNGFTVTGNNNNRIYVVDAGTTLSITDTSAEATGTISGTRESTADAGLIYIKGTGAGFNLEGGTIDASGVSVKSGAAVYVAAGTTFNMRGGTIKNGTAETGGNVCALGVFHMSGGTITGGTATSNATSGNVYTKPGEDGCAFTMTGGTITGLVRVNSTGSVSLGGTAKITGGETNLTLSDKPAKLTTTGFSEGAEISVNVEYEACYLIDTYFGNVGVEGDEQYIQSDDGDTVVATNGDLSLITDLPADTAALPTATGNYRLTAEITELSATLSVATDCTIRLDLNGNNITATNKRIFLFQGSGAEVSIYNSKSTGGVIKTNREKANAGNGGLVYMQAAGNTFNLYGGTLDGSGMTTTGNGGVIYVGAGSTFNMYGGTVTGGTATNNGTGGNIYIQAGSTGGVFNLHNGTVTAGIAAQGGNIYVAAGSTTNAAAVFNMYGGTVSGGEGTTTGGNVAALGVMEMTGGEIKDGICNVTGAHKYAANVYTLPGKNKCTFTMTGGTITGWVRVNNAGTADTFTLGGTAKITNGTENASANNGACGIYVSTNGATVTVDTTNPLTTGAEIYLSNTGNDPIVAGEIAAEYQGFFKCCEDGTLSFDENGIHFVAATE